MKAPHCSGYCQQGRIPCACDPLIARLFELYELDMETGALKWKLKTSNCVKVGELAGGQSGNKYFYVSVNGRRLPAHRVVFAMVNGYWPEQVDHINCDPTDNRPENLRAATPADNSRNQRIRKNNKSGVKCVYLDKKRGLWVAQGQVEGRTKFLGAFTSLDEAAMCAQGFREQAHGEFARHE